MSSGRVGRSSSSSFETFPYLTITIVRKVDQLSMFSIVLHDKMRSLFEVDSCNWSILLDVIVFSVVVFIPHIVIVVILVLVLILLLSNLF